MSSTEPPRLIAPYIKALQELDRGVRVPRTAAQRHFVQVCRGAAQPATAYERAYMKWRAKEQRILKLERQAPQRELRRTQGHEAAATAPKAIPGRWSDPKAYARFIAEPLGTREDFKKDTGANFAASRRNKL